IFRAIRVFFAAAGAAESILEALAIRIEPPADGIAPFSFYTRNAYQANRASQRTLDLSAKAW
ncbi:MAG: hypothetical protein ABIJ56_12585, partial [Pseudomonadota bacterium]